jgi:hypothetical protein
MKSLWQSKPVTVLRGRYGPLYSFREGDWFIGDTGFLACYDLFSYLDSKQLPRFVYIQFG